MLQRCKVSAEIDKAKKKVKAKKEGQTRDPRVPYDVLVQEGISPNPGPHTADRWRRSRSKFPTAKAKFFAMVLLLVEAACGCTTWSGSLHMNHSLQICDLFQDSFQDRQSPAAVSPPWEDSAGDTNPSSEKAEGTAMESSSQKQGSSKVRRRGGLEAEEKKGSKQRQGRGLEAKEKSRRKHESKAEEQPDETKRRTGSR